MTQTSNRIFDEMARLMNDAAGVAQGVRREFDSLFRSQAERILRADHDPLDPEWVQRTFADINLLVLEGDAAALAKHVAKLSGARVTRAAGAITESAHPAP